MKNKDYIVLGIESSCDETGAAIFSAQHGLLSNELYSQIQQHAHTGGVIPEHASREHMDKIITIVDSALAKAEKTIEDVDAIAVTHKPGLPGALIVGVSYAKALAFAANKPIIGIDHLQGHIFSACIENTVTFPFAALTVSGGHSAIYVAHSYDHYELLGSTLDDAAGEAFDKVAKLMNLPYPGGPVIEKLAQEVQFQDFFHFPRGNLKNFNFSFSGLKTAILYHLIKHEAYDPTTKQFLKNDDILFKQQVASSLLVCIGDIFEEKLQKLIQTYPNISSLCFVGGVACNKYLRNRLQTVFEQNNKKLFFPSFKLCTDNAGMIAFIGYHKAQKSEFDNLSLKIF